MSKNSKIEWTHHTFSAWLGCTEVSPACDHCYARTLVTGRMGLDVWGQEKTRKETSASYWKQLRTWDREAAALGERHRVFCGSLHDIMEQHSEIRQLQPIRERLYEQVELCENLDFLFLTKRPQNYQRYLPASWLKNPLKRVFLGTTLERADFLWRATELAKVPAAVRFLSIEPLLGPLDLEYPVEIFPKGPRMCCGGQECGCRGVAG